MRISIVGVWLLLSGAVVLPAQPDPAREKELLTRIKTHMSESLTRLPDYTCVQTVERLQREGLSGKMLLIDKVRLEVALVGRKELFGWPGAGRFEDKEILDLVPFGNIGNGNFALHAYGVFLSNAPSYTYAGERTLNGKRAIVFDYRVPRAASGYELTVGQNHAIVGYRGSLWVDKDTLDLIRLELRADDLPPSLKLSEVHDSVDYARTPIGDTTSLLPVSAEQSTTDLSGHESRNRTKFAACRRFAGQSTVSFEEFHPVEQAPAKKPVTEIGIPAGLRVDLALQTAIDSTTSYIGDPVTALVAQPVKQGARIIIPKGAVVNGRIMRLEYHPRPVEQFLVALDFVGLEFGDKRASLVGRIEDVGPSMISLGPTGTVRASSAMPQLSVSEGVVVIPGRDQLRLGKGFHLTLKTEMPKVMEKK